MRTVILNKYSKEGNVEIKQIPTHKMGKNDVLVKIIFAGEIHLII